MTIGNQKINKLSVGIVGAGPAGAMLAYRLMALGHHVTIIERKKEVERKVCGEYLCPKGVELLENLGLLETLAHSFLPLEGMVLVSPQNEVIPSHFRGPRNNERGLSLNRKTFDQNILNLALQSGATLLADKTVTGVLKNKQNKWIVTCDTNAEFEFDLLIAADGRQSKIGHLLGHIKHTNTNRAALHCYLPRKIDCDKRLGEMHILGDGSYCGLDPITEVQVNFSIVCDSEKLKKQKPKAIINEAIKNSLRLSEMFDLIPEDDSIDIKVVTTLKNKNHFIAGDKLAYVGDAAGFIDPLTGEGIYNALLSSTLLADALASESSLERALNLYKKKKKKLSFQKTMLNHFFQFLIRRAALVNLTANFLKKSPERANEFIGIIGNIHDPLTGFIKMLRA